MVPPLLKVWMMTLAAAVFLTGTDLSEGKIYTVGDSIGWTILHSPNYTAWAIDKTLNVGDILLFKYKKQFHNVLEVRKDDYSVCKNDSAIAAYSSGNDSIAVESAGHHYYICGVAGHCQAGQRVDIRVSTTTTTSRKGAAPSLSPTSVPSNTSALAPSAAARLSVLPSMLRVASAAAIALFLF